MATIPNDLWTDILLKLPAVSVTRFRSLSKFHRELIDGPNFSRQHSPAKRSIKTNQSYVILKYSKDFTNSFDDLVGFDPTNPNSDARIHRLLGASRHHFKYVKIEGCCNGIVCLSYELSIILWNPLTGRWRKAPPIPWRLNHDRYLLGHDSVSDELKVVRRQLEMDGRELCELYSSKAETWKKVELGLFPMGPFSDDYCSDAVDGANALHVIASNQGETEIVAFDFTTEKFRKIDSPTRKCKNPFSLKGCLCIHAEQSPLLTCVWMMKKYGVYGSWTMMFSVRCNDDNQLCRVVGCTRNIDGDDDDEVLLCRTELTTRLQSFLSYNREKKQKRHLFNVSPEPYQMLKSFTPFLYTPCLTPP